MPGRDRYSMQELVEAEQKLEQLLEYIWKKLILEETGWQ